MPNKIDAVFRQLAVDGRVGKPELKDLLQTALDGKGVTRAEAAALRKIRETQGDKFTRQARDAFDRFLTKMEGSWSKTKKVHLPNFDEKKLKELLEADPRVGIYTGRSGGGRGGSIGKGMPVTTGKSGSVSTPKPKPAPVTNGKGGSVNRPSHPSTGKDSRPTPVRPPVVRSGK